MKRNVHLASAIGPATREQLDQWADEHDRKWERTVRVGGVVFGVGLLGLAGLAVTECSHAFSSAYRVSMWEGSNPDLRGLALGLLGLLACLLATLWLGWRCVVRRDLRPVNPYRPIDVRLADLEAANAAHPGALAYLDAIRHQRRQIVQHDIDVLAIIRRQQQFNHGE